MSGTIKKIIDEIIDQRAKGDEILASTTKVKLMLKGINPDKYNGDEEDDPIIIDKLKNIAKELNVNIES